MPSHAGGELDDVVVAGEDIDLALGVGRESREKNEEKKKDIYLYIIYYIIILILLYNI